MHTITLQLNQEWHTHNGWLVHNEVIGAPEGSVVETTGGLKFLAFKPLLTDYVLSMPRGATIVYPKDAAMIVGFADIAPGSKVLEAGVGSGALSISLLRAIGESGSLDSFEKREEFAAVARKNISHYFGEPPKNWSLTIGAVQEAEHVDKYDRVVLDMLAPWECIDMASNVLHPGGVFISYVATTTQLSQTAEAIKSSQQFTEPESFETIVRGWHHEGLAVRPQHRMIGHTAFLIMARKLAPNTVAPARRRRPSKGAYGTSEAES
ncbi:MAG: tRNA (adenine-N1)-methyltransferase [SAR202 cluster bacterium]|nr:tRNA (adenine-N1)-methyltransferase [SAR202 cluster bacterium]